MSKIFLTGATGYIGGEVLHAVANQYPSATIDVLVRDASKSGAITKAYPKVNIVEGDLDNNDLLVKAAASADIVINAANAKHLPSVKSIADGIRQSQGNKPTYYIQISGASVLSYDDIVNKTFGDASSTQYDDYQNASEVKKLIAANAGRAVDQVVLALASELPSKAKTALVFPPIIYGAGSGPGNVRSIQIPGLCRQAIDAKQAVYVGKGEAQWGNVHIADLGGLVAKLVGKAIKGGEEEKLWGEEGLYFVATGEQTWKSIAEKIAKTASANGVEAPATSVTAEESDKIFPHGSVLFGTNARGLPKRGEALLQYKGTQVSLDEEIEATFKREMSK